MKALLAPLLFVLIGCRPEEPLVEVVKNECLSDVDCRGKDVHCDLARRQCVHGQALAPYRVLLKVQPQSTPELADAGVTLVDEAAFELGVLDAGIQDRVLEVPSATRTLGKVEGPLDAKMSLLETEITLTPHATETPIRSKVVNTRKDKDDEDEQGRPTQIDVLLNPRLEYDVRVQPLLSSSTKLPPLRRAEHNPAEPLMITYPDLEARSGRLASPMLGSWAGHRVRLEDAQGQVLSSVTEVAADGSFTLYAEPAVFAAPDKFKLVVGLEDGFPRWRVKLRLDGTRFVRDGATMLPDLPPKVTFFAKVEDEGKNPLPFAQVALVSDFPVPEDADTQPVGQADWCRLRGSEPSALTCSAEQSTTADEDGWFEIDVLPGKYRVFVTPASPNSGTHMLADTIQANSFDADGRYVSGPKFITVGPARRYLGTLLSPQNRPLPNVTINVRALALNRPETGEQGKYNRNMTAVTDGEGHFSFYADVGAYDLSFEPPADSGFAWVVCVNRVVGPARRDAAVSLRAIRPYPPVYVSGTVQHRSMPLPSARIEAFAVTKDLDGKPRSVLVARTTSDGQGVYHLPMPPRIDETDCPAPDGATLDSAPKAR